MPRCQAARRRAFSRLDRLGCLAVSARRIVSRQADPRASSAAAHLGRRFAGAVCHPLGPACRVADRLRLAHRPRAAVAGDHRDDQAGKPFDRVAVELARRFPAAVAVISVGLDRLCSRAAAAGHLAIGSVLAGRLLAPLFRAACGRRWHRRCRLWRHLPVPLHPGCAGSRPAAGLADRGHPAPCPSRGAPSPSPSWAPCSGCG